MIFPLTQSYVPLKYRLYGLGGSPTDKATAKTQPIGGCITTPPITNPQSTYGQHNIHSAADKIYYTNSETRLSCTTYLQAILLHYLSFYLWQLLDNCPVVIHHTLCYQNSWDRDNAQNALNSREHASSSGFFYIVRSMKR